MHVFVQHRAFRPGSGILSAFLFPDLVSSTASCHVISLTPHDLLLADTGMVYVTCPSSGLQQQRLENLNLIMSNNCHDIHAVDPAQHT